jgi:predicted nuclease of predicted toxin-antitoxin system
VRFLVDRCAGLRLANWLREQGHDVRDAREEDPDPGDAALLRIAAGERRVLITIDTDFGALVYLAGAAHAGIIRLPECQPGDALR